MNKEYFNELFLEISSASDDSVLLCYVYTENTIYALQYDKNNSKNSVYLVKFSPKNEITQKYEDDGEQIELHKEDMLHIYADTKNCVHITHKDFENSKETDYIFSFASVGVTDRIDDEAFAYEKTKSFKSIESKAFQEKSVTTTTTTISTTHETEESTTDTFTTIVSEDSTTVSEPNPGDPNNSWIGVVIAVVIVLALAATGVGIWFYRKKQQEKDSSEEPELHNKKITEIELEILGHNGNAKSIGTIKRNINKKIVNVKFIEYNNVAKILSTEGKDISELLDINKNFSFAEMFPFAIENEQIMVATAIEGGILVIRNILNVFGDNVDNLMQMIRTTEFPCKYISNTDDAVFDMFDIICELYPENNYICDIIRKYNNKNYQLNKITVPLLSYLLYIIYFKNSTKDNISVSENTLKKLSREMDKCFSKVPEKTSEEKIKEILEEHTSYENNKSENKKEEKEPVKEPIKEPVKEPIKIDEKTVACKLVEYLSTETKPNITNLRQEHSITFLNLSDGVLGKNSNIKIVEDAMKFFAHFISIDGFLFVNPINRTDELKATLERNSEKLGNIFEIYGNGSSIYTKEPAKIDTRTLEVKEKGVLMWR